jgi:hypothetical protein
MDEGEEKTQGKHCRVVRLAGAAHLLKDNAGVQRGTHMSGLLRGMGKNFTPGGWELVQNGGIGGVYGPPLVASVTSLTPIRRGAVPVRPTSPHRGDRRIGMTGVRDQQVGPNGGSTLSNGFGSMVPSSSSPHRLWRNLLAEPVDGKHPRQCSPLMVGLVARKPN